MLSQLPKQLVSEPQGVGGLRRIFATYSLLVVEAREQVFCDERRVALCGEAVSSSASDRQLKEGPFGEVDVRELPGASNSKSLLEVLIRLGLQGPSP